MKIKELRLLTGLSQSKFAKKFNIPLATLKDWEQERRNPPTYVPDMIRVILEYQGVIVDIEYTRECENRRKSVERMLAVLFTATNGPDELFMKALDLYIFGELSLEELERRVEAFEYLGEAI